MRTGEKECVDCGQRVLVAVMERTGAEVLLEPERTDGGWEPRANPNTQQVVAKYIAPEGKRRRDGHHAHSLRCAVTQDALADSRQRIAQATTEPGNRPIGSAVYVPVPTAAGLRALVGASS